jgi:hypothetical protein
MRLLPLLLAAALNLEVYVAFLNDQAERAGDIPDVAKVLRHDEERRHIVHLAIEHRTLTCADDYYHAAMVMQHGTVPDDFALARDLAKRAMELDPKHRQAAWLYAAATDRYLWRIGKPQIYGTQYKKVEGRWTLEPFDRNAVTDDERMLHDVRPLAERLRFIEELNAKSGG